MYIIKNLFHSNVPSPAQFITRVFSWRHALGIYTWPHNLAPSPQSRCASRRRRSGRR